MKFKKLIKADWSSVEEDWDGVEPYDKRVELEKNVKEQLERFNQLISKLDSSNGIYWEKEEKLADSLKKLLNDLTIVNQIIDDGLDPKWSVWK